MDQQRFDRLARVVAESGSRRGVLRGLAGVAALLASGYRARSAEARHSYLGAGDPCRTDGECVAADAPLICDDNGFAYDGPLNCCTYEGSRCGSDEGCCWDNACIDGFCASMPVNPGQGGRCTSDSQCLSGDAYTVCGYVAATDDFRCCVFSGSGCNWDSDCCGTNLCINGFCASTANVVGPGDLCSDSSQCVAADTAVTCDYNAKTDDYRCCAYEGSRCGWDGGCCGWLRCADNGYCTGQPPTNCTYEGCDCDFHDPYYCDDGLVCCAVQSGFICATRANCGMG
jgi:hypothetical protein